MVGVLFVCCWGTVRSQGQAVGEGVVNVCACGDSTQGHRVHRIAEKVPNVLHHAACVRKAAPYAGDLLCLMMREEQMVCTEGLEAGAGQAAGESTGAQQRE